MKRLSEWWGVVLVAESDDDARLLRDLYARIEGQRGTYEDGPVELLDPVPAERRRMRRRWE